MSQATRLTIRNLVDALRQIANQAERANGIKPAAKPAKPRKEKAK